MEDRFAVLFVFFACIDCLRRCTACACVRVSATLVGEPSTMVMAAERAIDTYIDHEIAIRKD